LSWHNQKSQGKPSAHTGERRDQEAWCWGAAWGNPGWAAPGAGTGAQRATGKLEAERGKDRKLDFSGRIKLPLKTDPY